MEMKKMLAGWNKICPGCNIGRKYPNSFLGRKVRRHWEKGCISNNAYVEVYGSDEPSPKDNNEKSSDKWFGVLTIGLNRIQPKRQNRYI